LDRTGQNWTQNWSFALSKAIFLIPFPCSITNPVADGEMRKNFEWSPGSGYNYKCLAGFSAA
jgi:hypothetical protein